MAINWSDYRYQSLLHDIMDKILSCRDMSEILNLFTATEAKSLLDLQVLHPSEIEDDGIDYFEAILPDGTNYVRMMP